MMSKKNVIPAISDEELSSYLGIDEQYATKNSKTESTPQTDDSEGKMRAEPTEESLSDVAKMASAESDVSAAVVVSAASVPIDPETESIPSVSTAPAVSELPCVVTAPATPDRQSEMTAPNAQDPLRRPSAKQRKASFDEYRETFLRAPRISDRQPVFVSREIRDRLDEIVRKLGDRKMSVSGLLENIARQHLYAYAEDIEVWKRL